MKVVGGMEGGNNFNMRRGTGRGVGKQLVYLHSQPLLGFRSMAIRSQGLWPSHGTGTDKFRTLNGL